MDRNITLPKWRQYRPILPGEFFVIAGDCSQGGADYNACQFLSKTNLDIPLVYHSRGVAAQMTREIFPVVEKIFDVTGAKPVIAFETANGGASEMDTLNVMNKSAKYEIFTMPVIGKSDPSKPNTLGYVTSGATRPILVSDLKDAIDGKVIKVYDRPTIQELYSFIVNKQGKPEAEQGSHDDLVMSLAIAWQMYQIVPNPISRATVNHVAEQNRVRMQKWSMG